MSAAKELIDTVNNVGLILGKVVKRMKAIENAVADLQHQKPSATTNRVKKAVPLIVRVSLIHYLQYELLTASTEV